VEIGTHGGNFVYRMILELLYRHGAHPAEPGEFTKKAFINGRLDLTQVEAVADLIHSESEHGARLAAQQLTGAMKVKLLEVNRRLKRAAGLLELELDFSEEEAGFIDRDELDSLLTGAAELCNTLASEQGSADVLRLGLHVAIVGLPNAGKSTLFNALLGEERAITSPIAGTTRDYLKESIILGGGTVHLYDTAGLRDTDDLIEIEGIKLVESVMEKANIIILLRDLTNSERSRNDEIEEGLMKRFGGDKEVLTVWTKADLVSESEIAAAKRQDDLTVSSKAGTGLGELKSYFERFIAEKMSLLGSTLVNSRQARLLRNASGHIVTAAELNQMGEGNELIGYEIRDAAKEISWITGERWSEQVLNDVFAGFCIGK
jgi:tRNA modification GTPase